MNSIGGIISDVSKSNLISDKVINEVINIIGQEKWQELHDNFSDICTTTGELLISLKSYRDQENSAMEGWYIAYKDPNSKIHYYSGCKMGGGWTNGVYTAKIYKSKDNAIKTILTKRKYQGSVDTWNNTFPKYVRIIFP